MKDLENFDQWTEQLTKQIGVRTDEQETKLLWKADQNLLDEDLEEEE